MKTLRTLLVIFFFSLLVASCGDDEQKVSPAKTKAAFENVNATLASDLSDLQSSPGFSAMGALADLTSTSSPFGRLKSVGPKDVKAYLKTSITSLRSVITNAASGNNAKVSGSEPFDYNANKGTYEWNGEGWTKTEGTIIKIIFPTEEGQPNNAEFQLTAYEEVAITGEFGTEYNPTLIEATLNVDDVKRAEIDLEAEYGNSGEPKFINLYLLFDPFTIELDLNDKNTLSSSVSVSLSKSGETLVGFGVTLNYSDASKDEESIIKVSGYVQLLNVRFVAVLDENSQHIYVKVNGDSAGEIIFVTETDPDTGFLHDVAYVKYNDGTQEPLSDLLADLEAQWESLDLDIG
jgi:hypothetical protein